MAGVDVGDVVLEVNGEDCHGKVEIAKVMELKALIQEVKIHETSAKSGPLVRSCLPDRLTLRMKLCIKALYMMLYDSL